MEATTVEVTVRYWAGARAAAGLDEERCRASSVRDLVRQLERRSPELAAVLQRSSLLLDGQVVHDDAPLGAGQTIEVLPPFAGG
jgi:sulfur-carrier protein